MRGLLLALAVAIALLMASCSSDCPTCVDEKCPARSSPENLLETLACAYEAKDTETYADLLHDEFLFVFVEDIAESLGLPADSPWWGREGDIAATGSMFEDSNVTDVRFSYEYFVPWSSCAYEREDSTYSAECCKIYPLLEVTKLVPNDDDPIVTFRVDCSLMDIVAVPDPLNEGLWVILLIEEHVIQRLTGPISATPCTTLSALKAMYKVPRTRPSPPSRAD